jgi:hypothetical protein
LTAARLKVRTDRPVRFQLFSSIKRDKDAPGDPRQVKRRGRVLLADDRGQRTSTRGLYGATDAARAQRSLDRIDYTLPRKREADARFLGILYYASFYGKAELQRLRD